LIRVTKYSHKLISEKKNIKTAIDMTVGNGNDTVFLANLSEFVYGFDIQKIAISKTNELLQSKNFTNYLLINDSHENIDKYNIKNIDIAIYNLGYLPNGDKTVTTNTKTTLSSLEKLLKILNPEGEIVLVVYSHNKSESDALISYTKKLNASYDVIKHEIINKEDAPYILLIKKGS